MTETSYMILYYILPILGFIITGIAQLTITTNYGKYKKINAIIHI